MPVRHLYYALKQSFIVSMMLMLLCMQGCTNYAQELGMSQADWDNMSSRKKSTMLEQYYFIKTQQASTQTWFTAEPAIEIKIQSGSASMWPYDNETELFKPVSFSLGIDDCKNVKLESMNDLKKSTNMKVCYSQDTLWIDPSRWDTNAAYASVKIHDSSLWDIGFDYQPITSKGFAKLKNAHFFVKKLNSQS